jgi:hypothetical protein
MRLIHDVLLHSNCCAFHHGEEAEVDNFHPDHTYLSSVPKNSVKPIYHSHPDVDLAGQTGLVDEMYRSLEENLTI